MLHHIIVKWNEKVADKEEYALKAEEAFAGSTKIPGVSAVEVIRSNSERANRYDLMIRMTMTPEGLANYDVSDMHKAWKENYGPFIGSKAIFDCEE